MKDLVTRASCIVNKLMQVNDTIPEEARKDIEQGVWEQLIVGVDESDIRLNLEVKEGVIL